MSSKKVMIMALLFLSLQSNNNLLFSAVAADVQPKKSWWQRWFGITDTERRKEIRFEKRKNRHELREQKRQYRRKIKEEKKKLRKKRQQLQKKKSPEKPIKPRKGWLSWFSR